MENIDHLSPQSPDPWDSVKQYTAARIAIGAVGVSLTSSELLHFRMDHAHARDAIYASMDADQMISKLETMDLESHVVRSMATTRQLFIQRPDLGRKLSDQSKVELSQVSSDQKRQLAVIVADGLSAIAVNDHVIPFLQVLVPMLSSAGISMAPITFVEQGRVAISDEIGSILQAELSLILIGERPGLSSPNSLGAYLTYNPKPGLTDESRNCVSNIRPAGLTYGEAAQKVFYLIKEALAKKISGVSLKDNAGLLER